MFVVGCDGGSKKVLEEIKRKLGFLRIKSWNPFCGEFDNKNYSRYNEERLYNNITSTLKLVKTNSSYRERKGMKENENY